MKYVKRFSVTERSVHWLNAAAFLVLLVTGLALYIPSLEVAIGRRPLMKDIHFWAGVCWIPAVLIVALLGDRRSLWQTVRELDVLGHKRMNVGQQLNVIVTAAFTILFLVSGLFLWLGERDTRFRFASTVVLHDGLFYAATLLFLGHLYLAVIHPTTRQSLRGMTLGSVDEAWAREHHPAWLSETRPGV